MELPFRIDRMEYLGSERILYGGLEGRAAKREVTAKLPAHVALDGIHHPRRRLARLRRAPDRIALLRSDRSAGPPMKGMP
jgi:hypothetical protein